jgi:hypothetical protein
LQEAWHFRPIYDAIGPEQDAMALSDDVDEVELAGPAAPQTETQPGTLKRNFECDHVCGA